MPCEDEIGEISTKENRAVVRVVAVEWRIENVLSYTKEYREYFSIDFFVADSAWYFEFYPNCDTEEDRVGWISVNLYRRDDSEHPIDDPKIVNCFFAVKKTDGTTEKELYGTHVFNENSDYAGFDRFLQISELQRRMAELAPSGCLTITCTLMVIKVDPEYTLTEIEGHKKLSQNLKDMFISQRGGDVTLKVKEEKFSVHKSILTARSPVLASMFEVDMKEKNTGTVDVIDCQPKPFRDFLAYLYSGEFENLSGDVFELYRIANKYDVEHLKTACVQYMLHCLSVDNVLEAALLGDQFDESQLKSKVQNFFNENYLGIFKSSKWKAFLKNYTHVGNELLINMGENMEEKQ